MGTVIFDDTFGGEGSTVDLSSHTPDTVGSSWAVDAGAINVVTSSDWCVSNNNSSENAYYTNTLGGVTEMDVFGHFPGTDSVTSGVCHSGVKGRLNPADSTSIAFTYQFNNNLWYLGDGTNTDTNAEAWPGNPTYFKLEVRDGSAKGYKSTDGVNWTLVCSITATMPNASIDRAGLILRDYSVSQDGPPCTRVWVEDVAVPPAGAGIIIANNMGPMGF